MFLPQQQHDADQSRNRENKGRLAQVFSRFRTQGQGAIEFEDSVNFGVTFIERPFVAVGHQVDLDQARDALNLHGNADVNLPQASGFVTDWDQDDMGHYTGCWVAVSVAYPIDYPVDAQIEIFHDFTWAGVALKDLPDA